MIRNWRRKNLYQRRNGFASEIEAAKSTTHNIFSSFFTFWASNWLRIWERNYLLHKRWWTIAQKRKNLCGFSDTRLIWIWSQWAELSLDLKKKIVEFSLVHKEDSWRPMFMCKLNKFVSMLTHWAILFIYIIISCVKDY